MKFGVLLSLVSVMKVIFILSFPFSVQRREPYLYVFVKKTLLMLACIRTFHRMYVYY